MDLVSGCFCEANGTPRLHDFWVCSNSGLVRRLGLSEFFGFGLLFRGASEASGAYSETFGFVRILGSFGVWVCSNFLDLVCCFSGASEACGTHSETFVFVRMLGLFVILGFSLLFLRSERSEWRSLSFQFWVCWVYLRIFGLFASFGFGFSWPYLA